MIIWDLAAIAAPDGVYFSKMINVSCCIYLRSSVHGLYRERASVRLRDISRLASACLRDRGCKVDLAGYSAQIMMAAAGKVEMVQWSRLRPRVSEPLCIIASIPPDDIHSFLRLLASNPLEPFSDATVMLKHARQVRDLRTSALLEAARSVFVMLAEHKFSIPRNFV
jgi:hypothetical protein